MLNQMGNDGNGSLTVLQDTSSSMSAFGGKADVQSEGSTFTGTYLELAWVDR